jgi:hypothetical protein
MEYRQLLRGTLAALLLCAALVAVCYFVDRPVAVYVHDRGLARYAVLKDLTYPPPGTRSLAEGDSRSAADKV